MHDMKELRRLALVMAVGFIATLGVLRWRDARDATAVDAGLPVPIAAADPVAARPPPVALAPVPMASAQAPAVVTPPSAAPAVHDEPASEETAAAPPPTLHVYVNRMRDTERRRVRVANTGTEPVDCLVRVWRDGVVIGERQIELRFNNEVTLGVDDDLEVHAGDRIVVQSHLGPALADLSVS